MSLFNRILSAKVGRPLHRPLETCISSKSVFSCSLEPKITKDSLLPAYKLQQLQLLKNLKKVLSKTVVRKNMVKKIVEIHTKQLCVKIWSRKSSKYDKTVVHKNMVKKIVEIRTRQLCVKIWSRKLTKYVQEIIFSNL